MNLSTRLTIAIVTLVVVTAGAVGLLAYRNISAVAVPRTLARADAHARGLAADLESIVANTRADVDGFRRGTSLDEVIDLSRNPSLERANGRTLDEWRTRISQRFAGELRAKPQYLKFRVIGIADSGRELIRAERLPNGEVRAAADAELQAKSDREFFQQAIARPAGSFFVSPVDLNRYGGIIEVPHVPSVRVSTPVFAPDGTPFGIVVIDVDLRSAFKRIDRETEPNTTVYVVNEQGDFLAHPDDSREFGFALGKPYRIQDDFPSLAKAIATGEQLPELLKDRDGKGFGVAFASIRLGGGPRVSIVETTPEAKIGVVATDAVRNSSLVGGSIAVLCAALIAIMLANNLTGPLSQMTRAVAGFTPGAPLAMPKDAGGEIGVLANAFEKMARVVRETTAATRRDAEIFKTIMASMGEAVLLVNMQGEVAYKNEAAERMLEAPPGSEKRLWAESFEAFLADGVTPLRSQDWPSRRSLRGEVVEESEVQFRAVGLEKLRHVVCSARPIYDAVGKQTGAVVVFRDVTEAKELQHQLRQSQKLDAIGQLTGGIAHDFNNMLTVITGTIEILADGVADRPDLYAIAKLIDQAAERGAELTKHLLSFARKQPLQPQNVDINALVIETAKLLRPTLGEQIEIGSTMSETLEFALIDPSQLSTALLNLAVNARDAMPSGGKLTFETCNVVLDEAYAHANAEVRAGEYVMIAVSDTGTGIPAALRDKVFEPFFTTKEVGKGTGLGLSMVYGFVKQSNGHVKIYSEEGHGTTIKLYLPRGGARAEALTVVAPVIGGTETILVVEDDAMVRQFLIGQLHGLGYKTLTAANAQAALAHVESGAQFDLLFTDVIMPGGMNGRELAEKIAKLRPGVKRLFTSGYTENAIVHHGRLDAGVLLLTKPYRKSDLARMIRLALKPGISPDVQAPEPDVEPRASVA